MDRRSFALAGASGTVYSGPVEGLIAGFYLNIGTQAGGTIDITITDNETGAALLTITNAAASAWYPLTLPTVDAAGAARLYAAGGTAVAAQAPISGDIKVVWAQGTAAQLATLYVFVS